MMTTKARRAVSKTQSARVSSNEPSASVPLECTPLKLKRFEGEDADFLLAAGLSPPALHTNIAFSTA